MTSNGVRVKAAQRPETARGKGVLPISMCGEWQQKRWMTGQIQSLATPGQGRNSFWEVPERKVLKEKDKLLLETANVRRKMTNVRIISFKKILKSSTPDYAADSRRTGDPDRPYPAVFSELWMQPFPKPDTHGLPCYTS